MALMCGQLFRRSMDLVETDRPAYVKASQCSPFLDWLYFKLIIISDPIVVAGEVFCRRSHPSPERPGPLHGNEAPAKPLGTKDLCFRF
jgi:hypothetical protein